MSIAYLTIKRQCALRLAQLIGTSASTLEAAYAGAWATALDGSEIPISGFKDQILMIEKELAHIIGSDAQHPYRTFLYGRSSNLANLASTPSLDNNGAEFVGIFDSVADSSTNAPLTLQPTQTIADYADDFFNDTELFNYNITGNQIRHTRPLAYLQGCVWNYDAQSTAYDADGDSPLPEMLANTWINGVIANANQVGWVDGSNATGNANTLYSQGIQMLRMGGSGLPNIPLASQNVTTG